MPIRTKTWDHRGAGSHKAQGRKPAEWSPLMSDASGWYRWFTGEGWRRVAGPEEGAERC